MFTFDLLFNICEYVPPMQWIKLANVNKVFYYVIHQLTHSYIKKLGLPNGSQAHMIQNLAAFVNIAKEQHKHCCCICSAVQLFSDTIVNFKSEIEVNLFCWCHHKDFKNIAKDVLSQCLQKGYLTLLKQLTNDMTITKEQFRMSEACLHGHLHVVQHLVDNFHLTRSDALAHNNDALRCSIFFGHLDVVQYLIEQFQLTHHDVMASSADVRLSSSYFGHLSVTQYLRKRFTLPVEDYLESPCDFVQFFVEPNVLTLFDVYTNDVLKWACCFGHLSAVKYLIDVFHLTFDDFRGEILETLCCFGQLHIIMYLVDHYSATIHSSDFTFRSKIYMDVSPIQMADMWGQLHVVKFLKKHFPEISI